MDEVQLIRVFQRSRRRVLFPFRTLPCKELLIVKKSETQQLGHGLEIPMVLPPTRALVVGIPTVDARSTNRFSVSIQAQLGRLLRRLRLLARDVLVGGDGTGLLRFAFRRRRASLCFLCGGHGRPCEGSKEEP